METKLMMVLTKDEMGRLTFNGNIITVDLHGLTTKMAERLIKNIIALDRDGHDICAIHGYHHGTSIKNMITNDINNPHITQNALSINVEKLLAIIILDVATPYVQSFTTANSPIIIAKS